MTEQQKADYDKEQEERKAAELESKNIIAEAQRKLLETKDKCKLATQELDNLTKERDEKIEALAKEKGRKGEIIEEHKKKLENFRKKRLGEIYWIMKEAEAKKADGEEYHYLIHNYLCQLFLEDHTED